MPSTLPPRPSLEWLRKTARQRLRAMRARDPQAKLADAQRDLAREHGFRSWRALKTAVESDAPDQEEVADFLRAVGDGEIDKVRAALAVTPGLANAVGPHPYWGGRPQPLHVAIETKRRDMFDRLLAAGADPTGRNDAYDHWSPIMLAMNRDQPEMRDALIAAGARVGLVEALMMGDDHRVEGLLANGLPDPVPNDGSILAFARTTAAIDLLLALGASATAKDRWGTTPLAAMSRVEPNGRELVRHMMIRGLAPSPEEFARLGDRESVVLLAAADPAVAGSATVMIAAVESGNCELVRWLIAQGADPNTRRAELSHQTVLHDAAWRGDLDMVKLLVEAGADRHARDAEHDAPPWSWAGTAVTITNNPACAEVAAWLLAREG